MKQRLLWWIFIGGTATLLAVFLILFKDSPSPQHPTGTTPPLGETINTNPGTSQPSTPSDTISGARRAQPQATVPDDTTANTRTTTSAVQPQAIVSSVQTEQKTFIYQNQTYPLRTYETLFVPNDPLASQSWVTQSRLTTAWDTPPGGRETLLAVIDTGFGLQHEEFENRWHVNSGESGAVGAEAPSQLNCTDRDLLLDASCNLIDDDSDGIVDNETGAVTYENPSRLNCTDQGQPLAKECNLIDDDGNGFVDDTTGWDFINNDNSAQAGELNPSGTGTTHGTRVTGIAAATGNNGKGIAGVDWQTKILPLQAIDDDSYGDTLSVGRAILYAASQGADVISLSLGSDGPDDFVREAVRQAIAAGSVVVASSGNDGCNCMVYPANYPEVVAVGALDTSNAPASFSSWGTQLDIIAPGTNMTSPTWSNANQTNGYVSGISGTSYAAPLVSGVLTRLLSHQPDIAPLQLVALLTETSQRLSLGANASRSNTLGYGAPDASNATSRATTPAPAGQTYNFSPVSLGNQIGTSESVSDLYGVQACRPPSVGTTPIYELRKTGGHFFSISDTENMRAKNDNYTSQFFSYACLEQPHDVRNQLRTIDLFSEFRNIFKKL